MATLANLVVRITGNTAQLDKSVKKAESRMDKFKKGAGKALKAVQKAAKGLAIGGGAALAGFALGAIKNFADLGDELNKMAQRTGFSVEELSALKFAAEQSGAGIDTVEKAVKRMGTTILDANLGSKSAAEALALIGLNAQELATLSPEQQFAMIAERLGAVSNESNKAALAQKIFGRAGTDLLPLFAQGATGMEALKNQAQELGVVMSGDAAQAAADFKDAQNELKSALSGVFLSVGSELVPALSDFIRKVIEWKPQIIEFFSSVKSQVEPFVAAFITGIQTIWPLLKSFFTFIYTNKPIFIGVMAAIGAAIISALGPVSLAFLAITGIITLIGLLRDNWDTIWGQIKGIWDTVSSTIVSIYDSQWGWILPGGPLMKAIFFLRDNWDTVMNGIQTLWATVTGAIALAYETLLKPLFGESGAIDVAINEVKTAWDTVWNAAQTLFERVSGAVKTAYDETLAPLFGTGGTIATAVSDLSEKWKELWDGMGEALKGSINVMLGGINALISAWNRLEFKVPRITIPKMTIFGKTFGGGSIGGFTVGTPDISLIPLLAKGGRVTGAGSAIVGERGPELVNLPKGAEVQPLSRGSATYNFYSLSAADFRREVERIMNAPSSQARAVGRP